MTESDATTLEDRLRSTYQAVTISTHYSPPPPIQSLPRSVHRDRHPKRLLLMAGGIAAILAMVAAVVVVRASDTGTHIPKPLAPSQPSLFPDVVEHQGAELLLAPQPVPAGYHVVLATGPDTRSGGIGFSIGGPTTTQYWVQLDAMGTRPQSAFSIGWGPSDLSKTPLPPGFPGPHEGDALDRYRNGGTPITIAGHDGYWSPLGMVAWNQDGQTLVVTAMNDSWMGTWPAHLTQSDIEGIANHVARRADGTYQLTDPPSGHQLAAQVTSLNPSAARNERRLVYSNGNDQGFSIQLVDNTDEPPGVALSWPGAQLVNVRGQTAVLTRFLNGGDGSACGPIDAFLCSSNGPGVLTYTYLQWLEPDSTRVTITADGLTDQQVLDLGRSLDTINSEEWNQLTKAHPAR